MNTIFVLVILFFTPEGDIQGGVVRFPTERACAAGAEQAEKDFAPRKINTSCLPIQAPSDSAPKVQQPKNKYRDA